MKQRMQHVTVSQQSADTKAKTSTISAEKNAHDLRTLNPELYKVLLEAQKVTRRAKKVSAPSR
jgi:hypothetical protein